MIKITKKEKLPIRDGVDKELLELVSESAYEMRKEDDLYFVGPFWIIGKSVEEINKGNFELLAPTKVLVNYDGDYATKVPKAEFLHKDLWNKYKSKYNNVEYNFYPRGRISFNSEDKKTWINIPQGLNESLILKSLEKEYDVRIPYEVKYTDPTSGNHYMFELK